MDSLSNYLASKLGEIQTTAWMIHQATTSFFKIYVLKYGQMIDDLIIKQSQTWQE